MTIEKAKQLIPWASQTRSKSYKRFPDNFPQLANGAYGCYIYSGGETYVDYSSAQGPIILGYGNEIVNQAVIDQISTLGNLFSLPHHLEAEVAEMLCDIIPCAEMVLFLKNGGDATAAAVRLAKKVTGRNIVLNKGYHGWFTFDQVKPFNDFSELEQADVAGIIIEPELFTKDELIEMRKICNNRDIILIFDEVISGFRIAMGGIQEYHQVIPDLACFSKAMANGYPISALVGKKIYMKRLEDDVFVSTTFGGDCIGLIAAKTTIQYMRENNVIRHLWEIGGYLEIGLKKLITKYDFPMELYGFPPMIHFKMPDELHPVFLQEMAKNKIIIYHNHTLNFCHLRSHIDYLLKVYDKIFPLIKSGKIKLEGNPIGNSQVFRQWRV